MSKRLALLAVPLSLTALWVVAPVAATSACAGSAPSARVTLSESTGTFTYRGTVSCVGAGEAHIPYLSLYDVRNSEWHTSHASEACTADCTAAEGTAASAPGVYDVCMVFQVDSPDGTQWSGTRLGRFAWLGAAAPVPLTPVASVSAAVECGQPAVTEG